MSRNCEDIPVFILMSTPLLIPYMGNREVCLEYCTGIRSSDLLQLPVAKSRDFNFTKTRPFPQTDKLIVTGRSFYL